MIPEWARTSNILVHVGRKSPRNPSMITFHDIFGITSLQTAHFIFFIAFTCIRMVFLGKLIVLFFDYIKVHVAPFFNIIKFQYV